MVLLDLEFVHESPLVGESLNPIVEEVEVRLAWFLDEKAALDREPYALGRIVLHG